MQRFDMGMIVAFRQYLGNDAPLLSHSQPPIMTNSLYINILFH
jgi:hypothetical protein